jgi:hypothetical protein
MAPARTWSETYAGLERRGETEDRGGRSGRCGEDAALLTQPDSICWLLNLRGGDVGHTPLLHAMAVVHRTGALDLFVEAAKLADVTLPPGVTVHEPEALVPLLSGIHRHDSRRQKLGPAGADRRARDRRGGDGDRHRPLPPAQGAQASRRDRRHDRGASARRRGLRPVPALVRRNRARGRPDRDRRGARAGRLPRRDRGAQGHQLRHHRGRRSPWRHRPLPRDGGDERPRPARPAVPDRQRRAIRGRDHRHHPHAARGRGGRDREDRLHPGPARHDRDPSRAVPQGGRRARISTRWRARRSGPRGAISTTGRAMASASTWVCTRGRSGSAASRPCRWNRG